MTSHIVIVEDEADIAELLEFNLKQVGYSVVTVNSGTGALAEMRRRRPSLVVLDIMLPDITGIEVCRRIRRDRNLQNLPVIMLTARGEETDRVVGFEVGADDYVVKPFSPRELALRVEAILRRSTAPSEDLAAERYQVGDVCIDVPAHRVTVGATEISLTSLEFKLLVDLAQRRGRVQSRDALLERVWGYSPDAETRTVDTHVKRLREKLGEAGRYVETVRGAGYRIRDAIDL